MSGGDFIGLGDEKERAKFDSEKMEVGREVDAEEQDCKEGKED